MYPRTPESIDIVAKRLQHRQTRRRRVILLRRSSVQMGRAIRGRILRETHTFWGVADSWKVDGGINVSTGKCADAFLN